MEGWSLGGADTPAPRRLVEIPSPSGLERAVLTGPNVIARAASRRVEAPEQRWLLRQPRAIRCSFVDEVIDRPDDPNAAERWMLLAPAEVRHSYVAEVLDG
jgi:hypothetical protein